MKPTVRVDRLRRLFRSLVEVYSPSGKEEGVLAFLEEFCAEQSCPYGVQPVDEERYNLVLGPPDAGLVFVGHVDTVDAWDLEAIGPKDLGGGWVQGLGTADMKGGCAAMVEAYLCLREAGLGREFGVALVVGEEEDGDGARAFLEQARPRCAVVGEPTSLHLCNAHYGYVEVVLSARGRKAHASIPKRGENAAEAVLLVLHALLQEPEMNRSEGPVLSIRHLETSNPGFAVPSRATAWVDVHVPPDYATGQVRQLVRSVIGDRAGGRVHAEHPIEQPGFRTPADDAVVRAFGAVGGKELGVFRSHGDANTFHAAGVNTVVLGPGTLEYAHTEEERVSFSEVAEAARLYTELAVAWRSG